MKVLFPVDEAYPLYKIGGLGDVGGSLPKALFKQNIDVRLAIPLHPEINFDKFKLVDSFTINYDNQSLPVKVYSGTLPGSQVPTYLFQENKYLSNHTDASDNHADKFSVFSLVVSQWLHQTSTFTPNIIHCHDWHTALIPLINKHLTKQSQFKHIITIHNLAYQGNTNTPIAQKLNLPPDACQILKWDQSDSYTNILLEGILHSDLITTVSPNYAHEILTPEYGQNLDHILTSQKDKIVGILNGLDYQTFNPSSDPHLFSQFDQNNVIDGKTVNKVKLQQELNLEPDPKQTMIGFVGRVDPVQKGVQLIIEALQQGQLPTDQTQFVFLGTGDPSLETQLHQASPNSKSVHIATRYDEPLAAKIYAASDLMLIPSKFEPCGLVQMIAMRYGALPVARKTGGLADTIDHGKTGFLFQDYSTQAMVSTLNSAIQAVQTPQQRQQLIHQAINVDFTWDKSAQEYIQYYHKILAQ